jgi:hypothetical protein
MSRVTFTAVFFLRMHGRVFMKKCCGVNSNVKEICHPTEMELYGDSEGKQLFL